jgi:hypothetical protein
MPHETHLLWGTYTWILFHWMSYQIKNEYFAEERTNLLQFIIDICGNLPCPNCREHASQYLSRMPLSMVKTKDNLIHYLYHFHNAVNIRGKKAYQPFSIIDRYKHVNFQLLMDSWNARFVYGNDIQRQDFLAKTRLNALKNKLNQYFKAQAHKFLMS